MIIFLFGEEYFLAKKKLKELKEKFIHDINPDGSDFFCIDGEKTDLREINDKISSGSLFSKRRMVVVENLFLNKNKNIVEDVYDFFKDKKEEQDDNIIIFCEGKIKTGKSFNNKKDYIQGAKFDSNNKEKLLLKKEQVLFNFLAQKKYAQEFKKLSNTEIIEWIRKETELRKGEIAYEASRILAGFVGNDLWQIDNEINKLINYKLIEKEKKAIIDVSDVKEIVKGSFDENIFALTDAISNKNKSISLKLIEDQFIFGSSDVYLVNMIIRQIKILLKIRQLLDCNFTARKISNLLKFHPFIIQKGVTQARNFNLVDLKNILDKLVKIDYSIKTGKGEAKVMLNLLVTRM